jgi:putative ABC transport system ATP-binding protein
MKEPLIRARSVSKTFRAGANDTPVLFDVSLDLPPGELALLMGPSGSGKTTLLSILAGLLRPSAGSVELCGASITSLAEPAVAAVRRKNVGFVFQTYNLFPALSALDNVAEIVALKGTPIAEARAIAAETLGRVGLSGRLDHLPGEMSGGEKQRVGIARAIAGGPSLILGDEPTAALDGATAVSVIALLSSYVGPDSSVLLVTHDRRLERYANRIIEIEDGHMKRNEVRKLDSGALEQVST